MPLRTCILRHHRSVYRLFTLLALKFILGPTLTIIILIGCSQPPTCTEQTARFRLYVGFNTSGSARQELPATLKFVTRMTDSFDPTSTWLQIWRTDRDTEEIYAGPTPDSGEALQEQLVPALQPLPADSTSHTAVLWETVAKSCGRSSSSCAVLLTGDGYSEGDDAQSHAQIAQAAQTIASSHATVVGFVGVTPGTREQIRHDFAALGPRLRFFSLSEADEFVASAHGTGGR